ncbi:hypothetical protein P9112_010599 [Eukaryota sp. TZLM1-RC]
MSYSTRSRARSKPVYSPISTRRRSLRSTSQARESKPFPTESYDSDFDESLTYTVRDSVTPLSSEFSQPLSSADDSPSTPGTRRSPNPDLNTNTSNSVKRRSKTLPPSETPLRKLTKLSDSEPSEPLTDLFDNSQNPQQKPTTETDDESVLTVSSESEYHASQHHDQESDWSSEVKTRAQRRRPKGQKRSKGPTLRDRQKLKKPQLSLKNSLSSLWPTRSKYGGLLKNSREKDACESSEDESQKQSTPIDVIKPIKFDGHDWSSVGGLKHVIRSLTETIILPLLYPDIYSSFNVPSPKGVLLVGPSGTGKTLVARTVAAVTGLNFFIRKGSDIMSKYVGEAERQLRLMFQAAKEYAPCVIFFDEIDGLAPPRASRSDNHYSSVVATLLALLDGIEDRGNVLVMAATNRPDNIDPALRRPGRFDRELYFDLPDESGRLEILKIFTQKWAHQPHPNLLVSLAKQTIGYSGADLKALCSEAVVNCIRRSFPEAYVCSKRLTISNKKFLVNDVDFKIAFSRIVATCERSVGKSSRKDHTCYDVLWSNFLTNMTSSINQKLIDYSDCTKPSFNTTPGGSGLIINQEQKQLILNSEAQKWFGLVQNHSRSQSSSSLLKCCIRSEDLESAELAMNLFIKRTNIAKVVNLSLPSLLENNSSSIEFTLSDKVKVILNSQTPCIIQLSNLIGWWDNVSVVCRELLTDFFRRSFLLQTRALFVTTVESSNDNNLDLDFFFTSNCTLFELSFPEIATNDFVLFFNFIIDQELSKFQTFEDLNIPLNDEVLDSLKDPTAVLSVADERQVENLKEEKEKITRKLRLEFREVLRYLMSRYSNFIEFEGAELNLLQILTNVDDDLYSTVDQFVQAVLSMIEAYSKIIVEMELSTIERKMLNSRLKDFSDAFHERLEFIPKKFTEKAEELAEQMKLQEKVSESQQNSIDCSLMENDVNLLSSQPLEPLGIDSKELIMAMGSKLAVICVGKSFSFVDNIRFRLVLFLQKMSHNVMSPDVLAAEIDHFVLSVS